MLLAWEAATGRLTLVFDFYTTANLLYRAWRLLLPDYLAPSAATWWRHAAWLVVLAGFAALGSAHDGARCRGVAPPPGCGTVRAWRRRRRRGDGAGTARRRPAA